MDFIERGREMGGSRSTSWGELGKVCSLVFRIIYIWLIYIYIFFFIHQGYSEGYGIFFFFNIRSMDRKG